MTLKCRSLLGGCSIIAVRPWRIASYFETYQKEVWKPT